jgi:GNAT superfamily N-acetyltransferase
MELIFKIAQINDLKQLSQFVNRAYRGESARLGWTHEADLLDGTRVEESLLQEELSRGVSFIMAFEVDKIVGCYHFELKDSQTAYVGMITVEPENQGQGLGKILIDHATQNARDAGCGLLALTVMSDRHELIAYYERRGFHLTGIGEDFNPGDTRYGLPRKKLRLIQMIRNL